MKTAPNIIRLPAPWEFLDRSGRPIGRDGGAKRFAPPASERLPRSGVSTAKRLSELVAAAQRIAQAHECRALVKTIQQHATVNAWSARATAQATGINRRTLDRLSRSEGKLPYWLPRMRTVVARLNSQPATTCTSSPGVLAP